MCDKFIYIFKKKGKKEMERLCHLLCLLHLQEVTRAVSSSSSSRPQNTPVNVCVCLRAGAAGAGQVGVCSATERFAARAVWSAAISRERAETLKVTIAAPLVPVNVTDAGTQSLLLMSVIAPRA